MQIFNNYRTVFDREVSDINSRALMLRHEKTGARIFVLSNDDDNKVFYIGFRTPPADSSGMPHIIEHSVLCGSEKYPVKDPFVELCKSSLNTFLNAMTYGDKTLYPCASRNDADFKNLMDVYLDAVFHPAILKQPLIYKQEGWSYKLESPEDELEYNGVVYNEMKGALSSPEQVMEEVIVSSLFPQSPYGVNSGGDPAEIVEHSYDEFIAFYKKYYHPSNSYIYLYGNVDIAERLEYLDREYLSHYEYEQVDSEIPLQAPFAETSYVTEYYPVEDAEEEKENTYLSYNFVCGTNLNHEEFVAMQMIQYALFDTQGAPVKQRFLDEGMCKDVLSLYDNGILQPYVSIVLKNAEAKDRDRFLSIFEEEIKKAVKDGINKKSLEASLSNIRFKYLEADFDGYPRGLIYGLSSMDSWLYRDEDPLLHIESLQTFDNLKKYIETDYYEKLLAKYYLNNPHGSVVVMVPKAGLASEKDEALKARLKAYKDSLSEAEVASLVAETKALKEYQEAEDSPEAISRIPMLSRDDIEKKQEILSNIVDEAASVPFIKHDYFTGGIAYVSLLFDANAVPGELIPYLGLLKSVISFVDTENYSYSDLNNEINIYTGSFGMSNGIYTNRIEKDLVSIKADLTFRALYENVDKAFELAEEVLFRSSYRSEKRLYEIIAELKSRLNSALSGGATHTAAFMRCQSYYTVSGMLGELTNGLEFYRFVEDLEKNFDSKKEEVMDNFEKLLSIILKKSNLQVSVTADSKGFETVSHALTGFVNELEAFASDNDGFVSDIPVNDRYFDYKAKGIIPVQKNEAFRSSGMVNYLCRAGRFVDSGDLYKGSVQVFLTIMRYEYLWFNIRVQGGAYGCMCTGSANGISAFITYRDPHIKRSFDVFEGIPDFLESFDADETEMTKYVLGTMSGKDAPMTPHIKGVKALNEYICKSTKELRQRERDEIINCTAEDIRALAPYIRKALSAGNVCVIGNGTKVEEDKELFKEVRNLFEQV